MRHKTILVFYVSTDLDLCTCDAQGGHLSLKLVPFLRILPQHSSTGVDMSTLYDIIFGHIMPSTVFVGFIVLQVWLVSVVSARSEYAFI